MNLFIFEVNDGVLEETVEVLSEDDMKSVLMDIKEKYNEYEITHVNTFTKNEMLLELSIEEMDKIGLLDELDQEEYEYALQRFNTTKCANITESRLAS